MDLKRWRFFLAPFSYIYFLIISLRNIFYKYHIFKGYALQARVISVGNITWGGTGKTPAAVFIAQALLKQGKKLSVLIRGYGNDEADLLSKLVPGVVVASGKDRVKTGQGTITGHSVDTILLDDGFQYRRLKRDLDIVCIDATDPFGNGWAIPMGSMREGLRGLERADIFLITKVDLVEDGNRLKELEHRLRTINPKATLAKSIHSPRYFYRLTDEKIIDAGELKDKKLILVSAIGSPRSFEKIISNLGLSTEKHFIFRDHYWYKKKDLEKIRSYCTQSGINTVITTEKDAIRLKAIKHEIGDLNFLILSIKLDITENEKGFFNRLFGIYSS
ncbi:tetraacyldisaccharide 4'-kinase [Candidatus Omnitrophota bacterium]